MEAGFWSATGLGLPRRSRTDLGSYADAGFGFGLFAGKGTFISCNQRKEKKGRANERGVYLFFLGNGSWEMEEGGFLWMIIVAFLTLRAWGWHGGGIRTQYHMNMKFEFI